MATRGRRLVMTMVILGSLGATVPVGAQGTTTNRASQLVQNPVFGVARGQVAHMAASNLSDDAVELVFSVLTANGRVVAEITEPVKLAPGEVFSHDVELGPDAERDRFGRAHLRVWFTGLATRPAHCRDLGKVLYAVEVFDGDTGKASVFFGNDIMLAEDHCQNNLFPPGQSWKPGAGLRRDRAERLQFVPGREGARPRPRIHEAVLRDIRVPSGGPAPSRPAAMSGVAHGA